MINIFPIKCDRTFLFDQNNRIWPIRNNYEHNKFREVKSSKAFLLFEIPIKLYL